MCVRHVCATCVSHVCVRHVCVPRVCVCHLCVRATCVCVPRGDVCRAMSGVLRLLCGGLPPCVQDVVANDIFCAAVANCGRTSITVSEEEERPIAIEAVAGGSYICCFDPIDGSSNLDACISSGSIFGIYTPG